MGRSESRREKEREMERWRQETQSYCYNVKACDSYPFASQISVCKPFLSITTRSPPPSIYVSCNSPDTLYTSSLSLSLFLFPFLSLSLIRFPVNTLFSPLFTLSLSDTFKLVSLVFYQQFSCSNTILCHPLFESQSNSQHPITALKVLIDAISCLFSLSMK